MSKKDDENKKIAYKFDEVLLTSTVLSKKVDDLTKAFNQEKKNRKKFGWKLFLFGTVLGAVIGVMVGLLDSFYMKILELTPVPAYLWMLLL